MRNPVFAFDMRLVSQAAAVALLAGMAASCSASSGPLGENFITGSTANQRQIIQNDDQAMPGPISDNDAVSRSDLTPPPGAVASNAPVSGPSAPMPLSGNTTWSAAGGNVVQVGQGDTLASLSVRYNVPSSEIARANDIRSASELTPGKVIVIPVRVASAAPGPDAYEPAPADRPAQPARLAEGTGTHVVQYGETLYSIARQSGTTVDALMAANNLPSAGAIRLGQRLIIPDGAMPSAPVKVAYQPDNTPATLGTPPKPLGTLTIRGQKGEVPVPPVAAIKPTIAPKMQVASIPPKQTIAPLPVPVAPVVPQATIAPPAPAPAAPQVAAPLAAAPQVAAIDPTADQPSANGTTFRWPVRGRIIASFGTKANGEKNDGINLAVPEGTSVKAAEAGTVIYAGNELPGYGNLVLIRHADGWVSAYAHNGSLMVKRGDEVRRGETIATAGMTGSVTSPQVHFELRRGAKPVNPLDYLAGA